MTDPSSLKVVVTSGVPAPARELLWEVFFASRGRGVSLPAHFPWIDSTDNVFCISLLDAHFPKGEKVIGALVIKTVDVSMHQQVGFVGLVCVAEDWRGKNQSSRLLLEATKLGQNLHLHALVLWTQKPNVYIGQDFVIDGQDFFGCALRGKKSIITMAFTSEGWPDSTGIQNQQGLPPFSIGGRLISTEHAKVVIVESLDGDVTLVKWIGRKEDVADLVECALPDKWGVNISEGDALVEELRKRQFKIDLMPAAVRMVKNLKKPSITLLNTIEFLDRV
ncbi:GNAT family N-acetyltransferase [Pseudomonas sp. BGI-2]|uniref:GNAT family N-acetyltransferase n=1 Tax=Pseudomonas sp. BGI-2 TaxID=2528211 RepID=UPI0013F45CC3|nr:GNAT family N-acetyltransferase [Pseudomonas sp. BGI-2]